MADRWSGPVGRVGAESSDGRIIEQAGFTYRSLPLPMDWQESTDEGHEGAVTVATIDTVEVLPDGTIMAGGEWLDESVIDEVMQARALVDAGVVYPSVEAAGCEAEWNVLGGGAGDYVDGAYQEGAPFREVCVYTKFEMAKVTLVSVQAFPDLRITTESGSTTTPAVTAAGVRRSGWSSMPVADASTAWSGSAAAERVANWAGINASDAGQAEWDKYARAFLWQDPNADPMTKGAYKLGVADVIGGNLTLVPRGVYAVAGILNGARGGTNIPQGDQDRLKNVVTGLYKRIANAEGDDSIVAPFSLVAAGTDFRLPPAEWFAEPEMTDYTPLTITPEGRVYGLLAPWDTEHIGIPGQFAPKSRTGYAYFHTGATMTDGGEVATGKLTVGGGHADGYYGYAATVDHYDNHGTAVATVRAGENQFGIWVAGAVIADATASQIEALRQSPLSGDWRDIGGSLELVAAHGVNTPGFPVPRARSVVASSGRQFSLIATAGPIKPGMRPVPAPSEPSEAYVDKLATALSARMSAQASVTATVLPDGFDVDAMDLREEFARAGIDWPTIRVFAAGEELPPYQVAEGCVRGALASLACKPKVDDSALMSARRKVAALRLDRMKTGR